MTVEIGSTGEFDRTLSGNAVVVADFHATWCGPCKMIAPTFESLSTKYAKPGKIAFCKIDVDSQRDIASRYSVRSMPTFIIFRSGSEFKRIAGADPGKLTSEVSEAAKLAGAVSAPSFTTPGRTLGGSSGQKLGSGGGRAGRGWSIPSPTKFLNALITFFGLYFVSLMSFDPYKAAENSNFNVNRPNAPPSAVRGNGQKVGGPGAARPSGGVRTLKDLGGS
ncbi:thioredoxin [Microdochium trichocladiopsis]|uniref:Thioredoxin n=1 Tax=Microdochium trichocladiopsis TaxID=1682393 RepID=A0A9P8YDT4_9PEZI|nr:thioredoxin [Microdochium trichocladiopsis]KAH7037161.1 thioredoxin [Microdochium trichocladiopsis]